MRANKKEAEKRIMSTSYIIELRIFILCESFLTKHGLHEEQSALLHTQLQGLFLLSLFI